MVGKLNLGIDGDLVPSSGRTVIRLALPQAVILRGESTHGCAVVDSHIPGKLALNVHRCIVRSSRVIDELAVVQGDVDNAIVTFSVNINEFAVFRGEGTVGERKAGTCPCPKTICPLIVVLTEHEVAFDKFHITQWPIPMPCQQWCNFQGEYCQHG